MSLEIAERALTPPSATSDGMPGGIVLSATMHLIIGGLIVIGLPMLVHPPPPQEMPIAVQLVNVAAETRATHPNPSRPRPHAKPEVPVADVPMPKPEPKPEPPKPVPEPPPSAAAPPPEPAPPPPKPEMQAQLVPPPLPPPPPPPKPPEPQALLPPPVRPPEPKPKPERQKQLAQNDPKPPDAKKADPTAFDALLKNLTQQQTMQADDAPPQPRRTRMAAAQPSAQPRAPLGAQLTTSEMDLLLEQLKQCWNIPAGARDVDSINAEIKVVVNSDATVQQAWIVDTTRYNADPVFRAFAESAMRALKNPVCSPLRLPQDKYDIWKNMTLNFSPKDVL